MNSLNDIWNEVLKVLARQLTPTAINTWFSDCVPVEISNSTLVLQTSSDFKRNIITTRFGETIRNVLSDIFSGEFDFMLLLPEEREQWDSEKGAASDLPEMAGYTFDRFIVGNSNKFAHAAAVAVAERPGETYNPLFIYGNSGLGKTHLLLSIGQYIHEHSPEKKIEYLKGDDFTNQMVKAIKEARPRNSARNTATWTSSSSTISSLSPASRARRRSFSIPSTTSTRPGIRSSSPPTGRRWK